MNLSNGKGIELPKSQGGVGGWRGGMLIDTKPLLRLFLASPEKKMLEKW